MAVGLLVKFGLTIGKIAGTLARAGWAMKSAYSAARAVHTAAKAGRVVLTAGKLAKAAKAASTTPQLLKLMSVGEKVKFGLTGAIPKALQASKAVRAAKFARHGLIAATKAANYAGAHYVANVGRGMRDQNLTQNAELYKFISTAFPIW